MFNIALFILFVLFSAFFSATETAIFSLSNLKLRQMQERFPQARLVRRLLDKPARLLSAVVFGNMLVNIGFASLTAVIFVAAWGEEGLIFAIFTSGIIILFLGEIIPKTFAIYLAREWAIASAPVIDIFSKIFFPAIVVMEKIGSFFSSFLAHLPSKQTFSDEELRTALLLSKKEGFITAQEEEMISYVLEFKDTWVSEIMTVRVDIQGIDNKLSQEEVIEIMRDKKHSKFPVYENSLDNIAGIIYAKDVFLNPDKDYRQLLRQPVFVPESKRIDDLLKLFLDKNERMAVVLDEYGGTEGIVTLEDIKEEIFGEIYDEFETKNAELIEKIDNKTWRIYGKAPIKAVNIELSLALPEEEDVLAGFILSRMEKIPRAGEKIKYNNLEFTVERATAKRVVSVILRKY